MTDKEYTYDIDKYTISVDENEENGIGLTIAIIKNGKINFLGNCYGENARCIDLLIKENAELKSQLRGTTHCFDEEEHNKLKEEITNLSKDVDMWNSKYNEVFDENRMLKKQVEERPKEYVFIGNAQNKTRDFINQITKDNKEFKNQQKEFIKYLEDEINKIKEQIKNYDIWHEVGTDINYLILKKQFNIEILSKYKSIIGVSDENNKQ